MFIAFPHATMITFNDGSQPPCDTNGEMFMEFLRRATSGDMNTGIPVKYGRAVVLRPIADVDLERTFLAFRATGHVSEIEA